MSQAYKPVPIAPFLKGCIASTDPYTQPKGSFPRGQNLLLNKRGALDTCDGTGILHEFGGAVASGRGKFLAAYLFAPIGVPSYYLVLAEALDQPLGAPQNLSLATAGGGSLAAATYFYKVTALDGVGGETLASAEASIATGANGKNTLTWNIVPNASSYNVYRSTTTGTEILLIGSATATLPVLQPAAGNLSVSFVDDGTTTTSLNAAVAQIQFSFASIVGGLVFYRYTLTLSAALTTSAASGSYTAGSNPNLNLTYSILQQTGQTTFSLQFKGNTPIDPTKEVASTGGTFSFSQGVPVADTTRQVALYSMPVLSTPSKPTSYGNSNIVALFPVNPLAATAQGTFSGGGGGGGGAGGGGGSGGTGGGGGRPIL